MSDGDEFFSFDDLRERQIEIDTRIKEAYLVELAGRFI